jgi:hypothetical protein
MCPTSRQQPYLQVIAVKIPFLVKVHPLPAVMTVASYRFQVVVALSMAQVVVSKSADSQKTNPKPNLLSEKMKLYYVISVTAAYSWKNELGTYLLFFHLAWWSGFDK